MKHKTQLLFWRIFIFVGLAMAMPATGAEAVSVQGKVYGITVEGIAYSVVTNLGQVTITPTGGGPTVTLTAGQISLSSQNGGAPAAAAAVMNDPALAKVVSQAAAMAMSALATAAGPTGADSGAGLELNRTLDVLMQALPGRAAGVMESACRTVPKHSRLLVTAGIRAAIASGLPAAEAGETMARAAARGACAASPVEAKMLALGIANFAILAAVNSGMPSRLASTIVSAVTQGTCSGVLEGIMAGGASVAGTAAMPRNMREEAVEVFQFVLVGAATAVMARYPASAESNALAQSAAAGARNAARSVAANSGLALDFGRLEQALSQGISLAFQRTGTSDGGAPQAPGPPPGPVSPLIPPIVVLTPSTPIDAGINVSPSR